MDVPGSARLRRTFSVQSSLKIIDFDYKINENPIKIFNSNDILDESFFSFIEGEFKKILKDDERKQFEIHRIKTDVLIAELIAKKN